MASMREHLTKFHERENKHHLSKAAHHAALAGHFGQLSKCMAKATTTEATKDSAGILEALAAQHTEQSQEHRDMAEFHSDCAEKCNKAVDAVDLNKLVPTRVSAIAPTITPVPRDGSRPIPTTRAVDLELEKALGIREEDWHVEEKSVQ